VNNLKNIKLAVIALILFGLVIALTGSVMADAKVNATPEIQGITTSTYIDVVGTATDEVSLTWITTNVGDLSAPLDAGQALYTATYNDNLNAVNGYTVWKKDAVISTANTVGNQQNIQMDANLQFDAADGSGRATREESLMIDGAATARDSSNLYMCPFVSGTSSTVPQYCNYVSAGSKLDTTLTSTVTQAKAAFVGTDNNFPVTMGYSIAAKGITYGATTYPMKGSVSAYISVNLKESRDGSASQVESLIYKDNAGASGSINSFAKTFGYQSGLITY
jgi:hypothetical protein